MNRVKLANNFDFVVQDKNDLKEHAHEVNGHNAYIGIASRPY